MTFSLVARCAETGMFGMAVASSSPAVAARCAYARARVGAVASQNVTDPSLGPKMLDLMERGLDAKQALEELKTRANFLEYRQILAVDHLGQTAIHSGENSLGIWTQAEAKMWPPAEICWQMIRCRQRLFLVLFLQRGISETAFWLQCAQAWTRAARQAQFIRRG